MRTDHDAPPLNPVPWIVWVLVLPMAILELALTLGGMGVVGGPMAVGWRLGVFERFAYSPDLARYMASVGEYSVSGMWRFVTYPFVHGDLTHAVFAIVIVLALGKFVGEVFRWWAVLVVFFGAAIVGALAYAIVPQIKVPLYGAYPGAYGLIGAFTFLIWVRLAGTGVSQFRAFSMIGFLLVAQLLFGVLFGGGWEWVADLSGFAAGFFLSFVVSPGGWGHVMARLRER